MIQALTVGLGRSAVLFLHSPPRRELILSVCCSPISSLAGRIRRNLIIR